jgi:hypothetical protein
MMEWQRIAQLLVAGWMILLPSASRSEDDPPESAAQTVTDDPAQTGGQSSARDDEFFEKRIRPLLSARCWDCHMEGVELGGELRLDSLAGMLAGGSRGPAIVPGKPDESLLIRAINHADRLTMPPKEKLPQTDINDLTHWVQSGAAWPNAAPLTQRPPPTTVQGEPEWTEEQRRFWAFQPVRDVAPPEVRNASWPHNPIDRFILADLEAAGLTPAPPADRRTLIRRLTFDLIGLPPTAEEVENFLADTSPNAYSQLVERLLASPRYGERWGRHWLDIARYGDSNGLDENLAFANAWRYRDYVIDAFNQDLPYDQFVVEQLAGDLLPIDGDASSTENVQRSARRLTATGFLVLGAKMLAEDDPAKMQMDIVDEQIDTTGRAFMGLTLGCARCHDHKFDPISMNDYYGLAGIFKSTRTMENFSVVARWQERPLAAPQELAQRKAQEDRIAVIQSSMDEVVASATEDLRSAARPLLAAYVRAAARQWWIAQMRQFAPSTGKACLQENRSPLPEGSQLVEAEDFQRGNVLKTDSGYGEGIGVILNAGPLPNFAEYDITIDRPGWYQLELRFAAAESRPVILTVDGRMQHSQAAGQVTGSWNPDTQQWTVEAIVHLQPGQHCIRLEREQPVPHIDKLLLVPRTDEAYLPSELFDHEATDGLVPAFVARWQQFLCAEKSDEQAPTLFPEWSQLVANLRESPDRLLQAETLRDIEQRLAVLTSELQRAGDMESASLNSESAPRQSQLRKLIEENFSAEGEQLESLFPADIRESLAQKRSERKQLQDSLPQFPEVMAVSDGDVQDVALHLRGNHTTLGAVVARRLPQVFFNNVPHSNQAACPEESGGADATSSRREATMPADGSGRLQLARWLASPDHPLTARVMVNRVWHWHFGEGLVRSPDNFGILGERPTHPALLDWLSRRFVDSGWSVKELHRLIVHSATYQMSARYDDAAFTQDPECRLWWRRPRQRLRAEAIRDSLLAVSDALDTTTGGSLLPTPNRQYVTSTANVNPAIYDTQRRSIYLPIVRSATYQVLQAFDFPDATVLNGKRDNTVVAAQALFMLNSELVSQSARGLAQQLLADPQQSDEQRTQAAFRRILSRPATPDEIAQGVQFAQEYAKALEQAGESPPQIPEKVWQSLCRTLLASNEFLYVD